MKQKVAIIFGGKSAEHEVSLKSAKNVAGAVDQSKYDLIIMGISKEGTWYQFPSTDIFQKIKSLSDKSLPAGADPVSLICHKGKPHIFSLESKKTSAVDIAFPVLHGTFGEDGCIQGLFKMVNLAFVGCGVLGSAVGMDKEVMKRLLMVAKIPAAKYMVLMSHQKIISMISASNWAFLFSSSQQMLALLSEFTKLKRRKILNQRSKTLFSMITKCSPKKR